MQLDEIQKLAELIWADRPDMIGDAPYYVAITFDDGFKSFKEYVLPELKKRNIPAHLFIPSGCMGYGARWMIANQGGGEQGAIMTPAEVKDLDARYVAVGSHCVSHRNLKNLDDEESFYELTESKQALETLLNREVSTLSFPHGSFEARHITFARQAGYKRIFSIMPLMAFNAHNEYVVGRVLVTAGDFMCELRLKIRGCYRWMAVVTTSLQMLRGR